MGLPTPEKVWKWFRAAQDEAAASGRRGGTVETEAQLQELAQEIGRQELALEQLTEGDSIAGQLTSEQLGRLALAMQEVRGEAEQNLRPAESAPTQNEAQEMQKLQLALDWENGTGELTEGGNDGRVGINNADDQFGEFRNTLETGTIDRKWLQENAKTFKGKSADDINAYLAFLGYSTKKESSTREGSKAVIIRVLNDNFARNISQVQVSPGGRRHGANPYLKFSTTDQGVIKIVFGDPSTYKTDGKEKAFIIFAEEDDYD